MSQTALKSYIGDGVYADFDGYHVVLTTEDGSPTPTNRICLDPEVIKAFRAYVVKLPELIFATRRMRESIREAETLREANEPTVG